jgi:hypothetical protein
VLAVLAARVDAESDGVDAAQVFHEEGLALHDAEAARRRAVAVAEHTRRVGNHGDEIPAVSQGEGRVVVVADGRRNVGNARGIPDIEPVEAPQSALGHGLYLAAEKFVRFNGKFLEEKRLRLGALLGSEIGRQGFAEILQRDIKFHIYPFATIVLNRR